MGSLFEPLEQKRSRGRFFVVSVIVHAVMLASVVALQLFLIEPLNTKRFVVTELLSPPVERPNLEVTPWEAVKIIKPKPLIAPTPEKPSLAPVDLDPVKEIKLPEVRTAPTPVPAVAEAPRVETPVPEPARPAVKTDLFSDASVRATEEMHPRQVQTGGFGDSNDASVNASKKSWNIAKPGAFDLPGGERPNSDRARSARGVVQGTGFESASTVGSNGVVNQRQSGRRRRFCKR